MQKKIKCEVKGYEGIEFEVGQKWKTRGGEVVELTDVYDDPYLSYPIETQGLSYTRDGREHRHRESRNDLVEPVIEPGDVVELFAEPDEALITEPVVEPVEEPIVNPEPKPVNTLRCEIPGYEDIEFEVGQQWITGDGEKITVTYIETATFDRWPIKGNNGKSYMVKGIYSSDETESSCDLVSLAKAEPAEDTIDSDEPAVEPVDEIAEEFKDNPGIFLVQELETSVEDKMAEILHQLLRQRDRDLEKISLVFNTFIELEKMK